jgi:hypothetical protein
MTMRFQVVKRMIDEVHMNISASIYKGKFAYYVHAHTLGIGDRTKRHQIPYMLDYTRFDHNAKRWQDAFPDREIKEDDTYSEFNRMLEVIYNAIMTGMELPPQRKLESLQLHIKEQLRQELRGRLSQIHKWDIAMTTAHEEELVDLWEDIFSGSDI